jgi:FAD/FMN-containing dehydrogenase
MTDANWADTYTGFQIPTEAEPVNWMFKSQFIYEPYPAKAVDVIVAFLEKAPTPQCNYFTNAFGGAVTGSEPAGGSAFAHRNALFYAEPGAGWGGARGADGTERPTTPDSLTTECLSWITDFTEALAPYVDGAYVNVPNAGMADYETAYWGAGVGRLRTIKAKYDPDNVFSFEQSIRP